MNNLQLPLHIVKTEEIFSSDLPPDFALVGSIRSDPKTLNEALHGPDTKHWQEALEYEISQLEKLEVL